MKTAVIPDTNVFIHEPNVIENLRQKNFFIYLPWVVILELNGLKNRPDVSMDSREALRNIESSLQEKNEHLMVVRRPSFKNLNELNKDDPDHRLIATGKTVANKYGGSHKEVKILTRDRPVRILANELGIKAEDYIAEEVREEIGSELKTINVCKEDLGDDGRIITEERNVPGGYIAENEGVICYSDYDPFHHSRLKGWEPSFAAIKKEGSLRLVDNDMEVLGVKPYSLNGNGDYNWHQHIAITQLLDNSIRLVLLQGGAGSGKTVLSLAAAIAQRRVFRQILVTRPMIPLEDEDRMGFLPGDVDEKMGPWLQPIWQSLSFLKEQSNENKKLIEEMIELRKLYFAPLDYIRGTSFYKDLVIVDDAQNLTPHQVKTIITRAGNQAKIVFTGDLGQIDRKKRLDRRSSGLAYATDKLNDQSLVAVTRFKETVRSPLASLAEEYL